MDCTPGVEYILHSEPEEHFCASVAEKLYSFRAYWSDELPGLGNRISI